VAEPDIVVCSFYTDDDYYRSAAQRLAHDLERLGIHHVIEVVDRAPAESWPEICRKKIAFVDRVCRDFPSARVFWSDVDCSLRDVPEFVRSFSSDLIGFQRGFSTPMSIGYQVRTRFWEPSFFGINATPEGRRFIAEAARLERSTQIAATDDYFLEEAWRDRADRMSFQVIPSRLTDRSVDPSPDAFFLFGASGNVAQFKGKVAQHPRIRPRRRSLRRAARTRVRGLAKRVESALPRSVSGRLRSLSDRAGLTHRLVTADVAASPQRQHLLTAALKAAQSGNEDGLTSATDRLRLTARTTAAEDSALAAASAFLHYARVNESAPPVNLTWWARPYPGNFGDWLSPLVVSATAGRPVRFQEPAGYAPSAHLVAIGSIGRFIKPNSVVVGTGIAAPDTPLTPKATYVSVRGPLTAAELSAQGGPTVESLGDPGLLLRRIVPVSRGEGNGRIAVVRHTHHRKAPLVLPSDADEVSVLMSHPTEIASFVATLAQYDAVVTSAMHVMIACHSYGIPCALVTFEGFEDAVPGSGMKYEDYRLGAGIDEACMPLPVPLDLRNTPLRSLLAQHTVTDAKLSEIEDALHTGLRLVDPVGVR